VTARKISPSNFGLFFLLELGLQLFNGLCFAGLFHPIAEVLRLDTWLQVRPTEAEMAVSSAGPRRRMGTRLYSTHAVADFWYFQGLRDTLPLDELAIGMESMLEWVVGR
jgi:hypothetical protein